MARFPQAECTSGVWVSEGDFAKRFAIIFCTVQPPKTRVHPCTPEEFIICLHHTLCLTLVFDELMVACVVHLPVSSYIQTHTPQGGRAIEGPRRIDRELVCGGCKFPFIM